MMFYRKILEINFCVVITAFQEFFYLFLAGLTRIGSGTCIQNGVLCNPSNVTSGYSYLIHMALVASMGDPPPIATIQSG